MLIPFGIVVFASFLFFFFNIFHLRRYGIRSSGTLLLMLAYLVTYAALLGGIGIVISTYDWKAEVTADDLIPDLGTDFGLNV